MRLGDTPTWGPGEAFDPSFILRIRVDAVFNHQLRDIAVIRLDRTVQISNRISPICLPFRDILPIAFRNPELHRCVRSKSGSTTQLYQVTSTHVQPLAHSDCRIMFDRKGGQLADDEFCAWDERGDTCTRDLGGPLSVKINERYHVVGLNSFVNIAVSKMYYFR